MGGQPYLFCVYLGQFVRCLHSNLLLMGKPMTMCNVNMLLSGLSHADCKTLLCITSRIKSLSVFELFTQMESTADNLHSTLTQIVASVKFPQVLLGFH